VHINEIRVLNYKGFADSDWLKLSPKFTVIVGKNNSGKTALLEAFRFQGAGNFPHRSINQANPAAINPTSRFDAKVSLNWADFELTAETHNLHIEIPSPNPNAQPNQENWRNFTPNDPIELELTWPIGNGAPIAERWPSHGQFEERPATDRSTMYFQFSKELGTWQFNAHHGGAENLATLAGIALSNRSYVFAAERMNIDQHSVGSGQQLSPNAANLPTVLDELNANPARWRRFNAHVSEVFPSIKEITVPPSSDGGTNKTICVWQVSVDTERSDLAIRLKDCGTGVSQVLAILYVAMMREGHVIVIDEPNSFLHPGAARKLIEILRRYDSNQYVISTHAPDLIAAIDPDVIHLVSWDGEQSIVTQMDKSDVTDRMRMLDDLGVKLSDVFGADRIIWVEGETEERCFPLIAKSCKVAVDSGITFVRVRNVGDLIARGPKAEMVWDVYKRLSEGPALFPPALAFSFDQDDRTEQQRADLLKTSGGLVHFLPRREFENYLLHPAALAAVIVKEFALRDLTDPPSPETVATWITANAGNFGTRGAGLDWISDRNWITFCSAAKLLAKLFEANSLVYSKISHGSALTQWLLKNEPEYLDELATYICTLCVE
jgi:predicted ATPase